MVDDITYDPFSPFIMETPPLSNPGIPSAISLDGKAFDFFNNPPEIISIYVS